MSLLFVNFSTSYVETKLILCVVIVLNFIGGFLAISSIFLGTCLFTIHLGIWVKGGLILKRAAV